MRFDVAFYTTTPINARVPHLIDRCSSVFPYESASFELFGEMEEPEPFDITKIERLARSCNQGDLELTAPDVGSVNLSWSRGPKAGLQLVCLDLICGSDETITRFVRQFIDDIDACYAYADLYGASPVQEWELTSKGREIPPYGCLRDLYWYNYFGEQIAEVLCRDHSIDFETGFLETRWRGSGLEVRFLGSPEAKAASQAFSSFAESQGIFCRYSKTAKFKRRIQFDMSQLR